MAINSVSSYSQYSYDMQELDYTSDPKHVSTEGCFACNMGNGGGGGSSPRQSRRLPLSRRPGRRRGYTYRRTRRQQQRTKRATVVAPASGPPVVRLSRAQARRPGRPILYLQPSLVEEIFNQTVLYQVGGRDGGLYEIRRPGIESGLWTLHLRSDAAAATTAQTDFPVKHRIRILGKSLVNSHVPDLNITLVVYVT